MGLEYYVKKAEQGDVEALVRLGDIYFEKGNIEKALKLYELAAKRGNAEAMSNLGYIYREGLEVQKNLKLAKEYFEKAAEQEDKDALFYLGDMHLCGEATKINYEKALYYHEKAYEKGEEESSKRIALLYMSGQVEPDYDKLKGHVAKLEKNEGDHEKATALKQKYIDGKEIDFKELFECEKEENKKDKYFNKIKERVDADAPITTVKNAKEIKKEKLNTMPNDSLILYNPNTSLFGNLCAQFYTVEDMKKIISKCYNILGQIDMNQKEEDIFMQIYTKLGKQITYDFQALRANEKNSITRNLMVLLTNKAVCEGYTAALKFMLDLAGIQAQVLNSRINKKGYTHAYNQVRINNKWYFCDLTNDSPLMNFLTVKYCLQSKEKFTTTALTKKNILEHTTITPKLEHEATEDYPNVETLYRKNYMKTKKKSFFNFFKKEKDIK